VLRWPLLRAFKSPRLWRLLAAELALVAVVRYAFQVREAWDFMSDFRAAFVRFSAQAWSGSSPYHAIPVAPPDKFTQGVAGAVNSPIFLFLMWPWTVIPRIPGDVVWIAIETIALILLLAIVYRDLGRPTWTEGLLTLAMLLVFPPVRDSLQEGQVGLLVGVLIVAAMLAHRRGKPLAGGLALGLAIAVRITPLALLAFFAWRRDWKLVAVSVATVIALAAATVLPGWLPYWPAFLANLSPMSRGTASILNQSLNGVLLRLWRPELTGMPIAPQPLGFTVAWLGAVLAATLATLAVIRSLRLPEPDRGWAALSLILILLPLVAPYAWEHHFAIAACAIPVFARLTMRRVISHRLAAVLCGLYLVLFLLEYPLFSAALNAGREALRGNLPLVLESSLLGVVALATILVCFRAGSRAPAS
jgi:hypothetical protein